MEHSLDDVLSKFNRYKESHPNIVKLWTTYINLKKQNILNIIRESRDVLITLDTINDIPLNDITLIYIMQSILHSNNT